MKTYSLMKIWTHHTFPRPEENLWFLWIPLAFSNVMFTGVNVQLLLPTTYSFSTCDSFLQQHYDHPLPSHSMFLINFTLKLWSARLLLLAFIQSLDS